MPYRDPRSRSFFQGGWTVLDSILLHELTLYHLQRGTLHFSEDGSGV
nr:unnamed protein product [Callosobruchus analis]